MIRSHIGSEAFTRSGHQPFWLHAVDYREFKNNRSFNYYARQFYSSRPLQIVVAWGHNILESRRRLFTVRGRYNSLFYSANIVKEPELVVNENEWNFAARGSHSSLWPEVTAFLNHGGSYSRSEALTVACGQEPKGFISAKSLLKLEHMVSESFEVSSCQIADRYIHWYTKWLRILYRSIWVLINLYA